MEINNLAVTVELPNYETSICEVVTSDGGTKRVVLVATDLSESDLVTYSIYVSTFAEKTNVRIINSDEQFTVDRRTSTEIVDEESVEIDYANLSAAEQIVLHNFYNLILQK